MSLKTDRATLTYTLLGGTAFDPKEQDATLRVINKWWTSYKAWEGRDSFLAAFREGRMTVRQIPLDATAYGEFEGKQGIANFGAWRGAQEGVPYPNQRYRVGIDSLKERMNPAFFGLDRGERLKYKRGLHDLSGSLCVPTIPQLTKQVRWKWGKLDKCHTIFMPLAEPEDMAVFSLLNSKAKLSKLASPAIHARVAEMRKQMTRLKLADSGDIGAGLRDVSAPGSTDPKFQYGQKKDFNLKGELTGIDLVRSQQAIDYKSILPAATKTNNMNEIVIAYRQHEGVRFPLFTKFDKEVNAFLCFPDEPSSATIVGKMIPDEWASTVEVGV
jgi:hypothetical protein